MATDQLRLWPMAQSHGDIFWGLAEAVWGDREMSQWYSFHLDEVLTMVCTAMLLPPLLD